MYEEREYRCLGQWREDGLIYTYTERRDMIGYECFVGLVTAKGLSTWDAGTHFDAKSQLILGERYAGAILKLQKTTTK